MPTSAKNTGGTYQTKEIKRRQRGDNMNSIINKRGDENPVCTVYSTVRGVIQINPESANYPKNIKDKRKTYLILFFAIFTLDSNIHFTWL
jgi:hypothetical protein